MIVVTLRYIVWNYTFVPFQQIRVKVNFLVTGAARSIYQLLIVPAAADFLLLPQTMEDLYTRNLLTQLRDITRIKL